MGVRTRSIHYYWHLRQVWLGEGGGNHPPGAHTYPHTHAHTQITLSFRCVSALSRSLESTKWCNHSIAVHNTGTSPSSRFRPCYRPTAPSSAACRLCPMRSRPRSRRPGDRSSPDLLAAYERIRDNNNTNKRLANHYWQALLGTTDIAFEAIPRHRRQLPIVPRLQRIQHGYRIFAGNGVAAFKAIPRHRRQLVVAIAGQLVAIGVLQHEFVRK